MDFNEKHLNTIDNLLKFLPRCRPPEDATLEESFVFAQSYYFLYDLKKFMTEELAKKKQQAAATQAMMSASAKSKAKKTEVTNE
jgi:hypothetical protein